MFSFDLRYSSCTRYVFDLRRVRGWDFKVCDVAIIVTVADAHTGLVGLHIFYDLTFDGRPVMVDSNLLKCLNAPK